MSLRTQGQRQILQVTIYVWHWQKKLITGKIVNSVLTLNLLGIASFSFYKPVLCRICWNLTILYGKRLICNWEHSLRKQASTKNKPIYRRLLSMHLTFFLFFYFFEILH